LVTSSAKDRLRPVRPVFCRSLNFRNRERPKTGPRLRSLTVLQISGLGQSWSSPVSVFFQSWDWTSKHYMRSRFSMVILTIFTLRGCVIMSDEGKYTIVMAIDFNTITIIPYDETVARGFCGCWHADMLRIRHVANWKL
jgi:hypothetical protein